MVRLSNSGYFLLGAAYWVAVAVLVFGALQIWPHLQDSEPFFYAAILGALAGGFAVVILFKPKS